MVRDEDLAILFFMGILLVIAGITANVVLVITVLIFSVCLFILEVLDFR